MFLPNPMVYIQFHPVTYIVKLNIELKMASLIRKLARDSNINNEIHEASMNLRTRFNPQSHYIKCDDEVREKRNLRHMQFAQLRQQGFESEDMKILKTTSVRVVTSPRPIIYLRCHRCQRMEDELYTRAEFGDCGLVQMA
ncbi:unnamed protein product [Aspergillus oryzae RIB40]|uniref:DNA, SC038 n=1 Tax=Aspergillus oryzae (strain ATCC 42149 / RIB 40) TaxID=510516 RepID=Q2U327_ASPOR|nr:unnamed protein product [Aspergillus oryzae RIB40]BAE64038.1 unnamed protein product [Aspergillus oryzae RIB40]